MDFLAHPSRFRRVKRASSHLSHSQLVKIAKYQYKVAENRDLEVKFQETDPYRGEIPKPGFFGSRLRWLNNVYTMGYVFISDITGPISRLLIDLMNWLFESPVLNYFLAGHFQDVRDRAVIHAIKSFKRGMAYRDNASEYDKLEAEYLRRRNKEEGIPAINVGIPYNPDLAQRTKDILSTYGVDAPTEKKLVPFLSMTVKVRPKQKSYKDLPPLPGFPRGKLPPAFSSDKGVIHEFFLLGYWRAHEKIVKQVEDASGAGRLKRLKILPSTMSEADRNLVVDRVNLEINSKLTVHFFKDILHSIAEDPLYIGRILKKTWSAYIGGSPKKVLWRKIKDGAKGGVVAMISSALFFLVKWKIGAALVGMYAAVSLFGWSGKALAFWLLGGIPITYIANKAGTLFRETASKKLKDYEITLSLLAEEITDEDVDVREGLDRIRALNRSKLVSQRDLKRDQARLEAIVGRRDHEEKTLALMSMTKQQKREYESLQGKDKTEFLDSIVRENRRSQPTSPSEDYEEYRRKVLSQKELVDQYLEEEIEVARAKYRKSLIAKIKKQERDLHDLKEEKERLNEAGLIIPNQYENMENSVKLKETRLQQTKDELDRFDEEQTLPPGLVSKIWESVKESVGEMIPDSMKPIELEELIHKGDEVYGYQDRNS
jgi:hypothetical protein